VVEAVTHAHLSPTIIKPAGRALLAQSSFTVNLEAFRVYSATTDHRYLGSVWKILMEQLDAKLMALGEAARAFNEQANVATELGSAAGCMLYPASLLPTRFACTARPSHAGRGSSV
jgi:hypothetical protein